MAQEAGLVGRLTLSHPAPLDTQVRYFVLEKVPQLESISMKDKGLAGLLVDNYAYDLQGIPGMQNDTDDSWKTQMTLVTNMVRRLRREGKLRVDPLYGIVVA